MHRGSPPRVRGKVRWVVHRLRPRGITPACAGKSSLGCDRCKFSQDHPRVCGEKVMQFSARCSLTGSPPRVRGKAVVCLSVEADEGITPACAGKRKCRTSHTAVPKDHPRVCGEKYAQSYSKRWRRGSPPRVRGKGHPFLAERRHFGITPACAGKRLKRSHSIGHFSCILCLFHSVLHRASVSGGSRAGPCAPPCLPAQNAVPM